MGSPRPPLARVKAPPATLAPLESFGSTLAPDVPPMTGPAQGSGSAEGLPGRGWEGGPLPPTTQRPGRERWPGGGGMTRAFPGACPPMGTPCTGPTLSSRGPSHTQPRLPTKALSLSCLLHPGLRGTVGQGPGSVWSSLVLAPAAGAAVGSVRHAGLLAMNLPLQPPRPALTGSGSWAGKSDLWGRLSPALQPARQRGTLAVRWALSTRPAAPAGP